MPPGFERIELVGEKVRLRPAVAADAAEAYRLVTDDRILRWLLWEGPDAESDMVEVFGRWQRQLRCGEDYNFAIERRDEPGVIGCISSRPVEHQHQADIGYWLGVPFWNRGYMTEAVGLISHFSFEHLCAVRVYATVMVGNGGSRRALEKNGFSLDGTLRSHALKRGEWRDEWFLSLLRSEWQAGRERYLPRDQVIVPPGGE
jgi:ribosomal-protein-alanine N-acetyltransferase